MTNNNKLNLPPFYVGQRVVCINTDGWAEESGRGDPCDGPKYKEELVVNHLYLEDYEWAIVFNKYGSEGYEHYWFKPLESIKPPLLTFQQVRQTEKEEVLILN